MLSLQDYTSDSSGHEEETDDVLKDLTVHLKPIQSGKPLVSNQKLDAAPLVITKVLVSSSFLPSRVPNMRPGAREYTHTNISRPD